MQELGELSEDGAFRVGAPPPGRSPEQLLEMRRAFSRRKVDDNGAEIDLRRDANQVAAAGTYEPIDDFENFPTAPRYDPETGELLRPLALRPDEGAAPHPSQIPLAQSHLNYAPPELNPSLSLFRPLRQLLTPVNLAAMFFVLLGHVFLIFATLSIYLVILALLGCGAALIGHYANVVEEVGIEERDELPRFLRQFSLADDIWHPFLRVLLAWTVCFALGWLAALVVAILRCPAQEVYATWIVLESVGLVLFPAVALITITSGSLANLRPDRILGTIAQIGPRYAFLVVLYPVAFGIYICGVGSTLSHAMSVYAFIRSPVALAPSPPEAWFYSLAGAYEMLIIGIFLMHYFAWLLGLAYRVGHGKFPWVYQRRQRVLPGINAPRYSKPVHSPPPIQDPAAAPPPSE
jgi:hypothetical protein